MIGLSAADSTGSLSGLPKREQIGIARGPAINLHLGRDMSIREHRLPPNTPTGALGTPAASAIVFQT